MKLLAATLFVFSFVQAFDRSQKPLTNQASRSRPSEITHEIQPLEFELRHIFQRGSTKYPELHRRIDIHNNDEIGTESVDGVVTLKIGPSRHRARSRPAIIERLTDRRPAAIAAVLDAGTSAQGQWTTDEIKEPDISDKETVLSFARMANDAYYLEPGSGKWKDVGSGFNFTEHFGWENDGIRGHVFADRKNSTVVVAMKGTSLPFVDPRGTISNDKINDNLLFSCCCGQGGRWLWTKVCDCQTEYHVGNNTCLKEQIKEKTRYYHAGLELYHNITELYPDANIWLAGHSLGGSVASLLALTVGVPAVTFEAPADAIAADRLGLPTPPGFRLGNDTQAVSRTSTLTYHFGHTADDIFMGNCNAWNSVCTIGGYAMEAMCHTGSICIYDTVKDKGWSSNARSNHGIGLVTDDVIDSYDEVAKCEAQTQCRDCDDWHFFGEG